MKDQISIYVAIALIIFVGYRFYQRHFGKDSEKDKSNTHKKESAPGFNDDDYEPYSRK